MNPGTPRSNRNPQGTGARLAGANAGNAPNALNDPGVPNTRNGHVHLVRPASRSVIAMFLMAILVPGLATILGIDRGNRAGENRELAPPPVLAWQWDTIVALPDGFTKYFEDNFAFRSRLVTWQAAFRLRVLGVSPSTAVVKGDDGWLYYADDGALEDYAEAPPFSDAELEVWRRTLQDTADWMEARGIAFVFVIAPDKHVVYPEHIPETIRPSGHSRIDQLARHLAAHSTVRVVDLRPALAAAKVPERIYHRTDTHWNDRGAYAGYAAIIDALRPARPELAPTPRAAFASTTAVTPGMDLAGMLGLTTVLSEEDLRLEPREPRLARVVDPVHPDPHGIEARLATERGDGRGPRAVVFRDSFGSALIPFLSEHFSRALYLWQYNVDPDVVTQERATVVIQEWVGRRLTTLLPYDPFAAGESNPSTAPNQRGPLAPATKNRPASPDRPVR